VGHYGHSSLLHQTTSELLESSISDFESTQLAEGIILSENSFSPRITFERNWILTSHH
jgi:hypothetical protein